MDGLVAVVDGTTDLCSGGSRVKRRSARYWLGTDGRAGHTVPPLAECMCSARMPVLVQPPLTRVEEITSGQKPSTHR